MSRSFHLLNSSEFSQVFNAPITLKRKQVQVASDKFISYAAVEVIFQRLKDIL